MPRAIDTLFPINVILAHRRAVLYRRLSRYTAMVAALSNRSIHSNVSLIDRFTIPKVLFPICIRLLVIEHLNSPCSQPYL